MVKTQLRLVGPLLFGGRCDGSGSSRIAAFEPTAPGTEIPRFVFRTTVFLVMVVEGASTWMPSMPLVLTKFFSDDEPDASAFTWMP
jgi:hypothetical protein